MATYKVIGIEDAAVLTSGDSTDIPYGNTLTMNTEFTTITFEGDGTSEDYYYNQELTGTIGGDKWSTTVLEKLYAKTAITGVSGEASSYYMGVDAELIPAVVGLQVDLAAINDADESAASLRITIFRARMEPVKPPDVANEAKWAPHIFTWRATATETDINGIALPGVPSGGALYRIGILD